MIGFILSNDQVHCRRSPAIRQQCCCCGSCIVIQVSEYLLNNCWVFDTGNDVHGSTNAVGAGMRRNGNLDIATAFATSLNVDKVN